MFFALCGVCFKEVVFHDASLLFEKLSFFDQFVHLKPGKGNVFLSFVVNL